MPFKQFAPLPAAGAAPRDVSHAKRRSTARAVDARLLGVAWFLVLPVLLIGLSATPLHRSQEARVLETAREMHEGASWLVPHVNGHVRLKKPPLAYWLGAESFELFGVSEAAGRVPAALAGWLTVGLTFLAGRRLFGTRAGAVGAVALLGSALFFRFTRLAETDPLVALFVTAAIYAFLRGFGAPGDEDPPAAPSPRWFHLAAASMALALLTKGPPATYPLLALLGWCAVERRWDAARRFIRSGAPLTCAALALPWFAYVMFVPEAGQMFEDLGESAGGGGHRVLFLNYFAMLVPATAPWTPFAALALVAGIARWRDDARVRLVLVWILAILVPLCAWGNKQPHYLLPLMPPLMILVGWAVELCLRADSPRRLAGAMRAILLVMCGAALAVVAPGVLITAGAVCGSIGALDLMTALAVAALGAVALRTYAKRGPRDAMTWFTGASAAAVVLTLGLWLPTMQTIDPRRVARQIIGEFGRGPYAFYGSGENLLLCFYLRTTIPWAETPAELTAALEKRPETVVLETVKSSVPTAPIPPQLRLHRTYDLGRRTLKVWTTPAATTTAKACAPASAAAAARPRPL